MSSSIPPLAMTPAQMEKALENPDALRKNAKQLLRFLATIERTSCFEAQIYELIKKVVESIRGSLWEQMKTKKLRCGYKKYLKRSPKDASRDAADLLNYLKYVERFSANDVLVMAVKVSVCQDREGAAERFLDDFGRFKGRIADYMVLNDIKDSQEHMRRAVDLARASLSQERAVADNVAAIESTVRYILKKCPAAGVPLKSVMKKMLAMYSTEYHSEANESEANESEEPARKKSNGSAHYQAKQQQQQQQQQESSATATLCALVTAQLPLAEDTEANEEEEETKIQGEEEKDKRNE